MSIIIATTAAEAAAVVRELDGTSTTITTTLDLPWSGLASEGAAATAGGDDADDTTEPAAEVEDTPKAPRRLKSWTAEEENQVKVWIRKGMSVKEVAYSLGRTYASVNNKLHALEKERRNLRETPIRPKKVTA